MNDVDALLHDPVHGRRALLRMLDGFKTWDDDEAAAIAQTRALIEANPRCFERDSWSGHITASAWVLNPARTRVLVTEHRKLKQWLQLGGHCDGDPRVLQVALKEAYEESGLPHGAIRILAATPFDVSVHAIPPYGDAPLHNHHDIVFLMEADDRIPLQISDESTDLAWMSLDDPRLHDRPRQARMASNSSDLTLATRRG